MTFFEEVKAFAEKAKTRKDSIKTEQGTITSLVLPFFQLLGYDTADPCEFEPEHKAGFKHNAGERVDFAIKQDGNPVILIEVKFCGEQLGQHVGQLAGYYAASHSAGPGAKFAVLTNGLEYRFYTDSKSLNIMDGEPFLEVDLLSLNKKAGSELELFRKEVFDAGKLHAKAFEMRCEKEFCLRLRDELEKPSDAFVRLLSVDGIEDMGQMEKLRQILISAIGRYIDEHVESQPLPVEKLDDAPGLSGKEETAKKAVSAVKGLFAGKINADKLEYWETKTGITVGYFGCILCKLRFAPDGTPTALRFMTSDGTYPRKVKYDADISAASDFAEFKEEFAEQIEQVKMWVKGANI